MNHQPLPTPVKMVDDEQVKAYQVMVSKLAKRCNGWSGAEYDDLFQEGCLAVFLCLRDGKTPAQDIVFKRMLNWVRVCARHGLGHDEIPQED